MSTTIPAEFSDVYNKDKYKQSQEYLITKTKFSLIQQGIVLVITLGFIFYGGFNALDLYVRGLLLNSTQTGVIYMLLLMGAVSLIGLPFNYYSTFVIEEKFNFNKSTRLLFFSDLDMLP